MSITLVARDGISTMKLAPEKGGMGYSLVLPGKHGPRELLYLHDSFQNDEFDDLVGGWPLCFPICARLQRDGQIGAYLYQGRRYTLPIHGISWYQAWQVVAQDSDAVSLYLSSNEHSRQHFPFDFELTQRFEVLPGEMRCQLRIENSGNEGMPYYAGFHPYLLTPQPNEGKGQVMIKMNSDYRLQYNEGLTDIIGHQEPLCWPLSAADPAINEQLSHIVGENMCSIDYGDGDCLSMHCVGSDGMRFPYLQTYTMANKPFICLEPWMSHPNAMNTVGACAWLMPGQSHCADVLIKLTH